VAVSVAGDAEWSRLRGVLGDPEWAGDPALATAEGRRAAWGLLDKGLGEWFAVRSSAAALAALRAGGVPAEPVVPAYAVDDDEQMRARGFWEAVDHPVVGRVTYPGWPMRMSQVQASWYRRPAPLLGQHNDEVLGAELGLTDDHLARLRAAGVIGERPARS
jgi:crotonobetainyl-CoA:carnitine CoA-transferase CaiB-like acyl-CoA transferase